MKIQQTQNYQPKFGMALKKPNTEVTKYLTKLFGTNLEQAQEFADTFQKVAKRQEKNNLFDIEADIITEHLVPNKFDTPRITFPGFRIRNKETNVIEKTFKGSDKFPTAMAEALKEADKAAISREDGSVAQEMIEKLMNNL